MRKQQKSFNSANQGALYLVPTPIGNLEDMTFRAIRVLKEADLIAAEDTRQTVKLLNHFEIPTALTSYHEHNKRESGIKILDEIRNGKTVALVSDAGMPAISDPGYDLVVDALAENIAVIALPGANAALTALIASGLPTNHFYYYGFLPRGKKERVAELERLQEINDPIIFYEAPHRLKETLSALEKAWGPDRKASLSRELTKKFEEYIRGTISELIQWADEEAIRGEFCIVVEGANIDDFATENNWWADLHIKEHVEHYMEKEGLRSKDAIKKVADERGIPKRDVYQSFHIE
ncbi:MAG TPA: 16S rRNA (cytidine(1402)-2'-O)-methyltransferase [Bacillus bacterium]|nr:16S rRNA (cytidine(1402)-2'-O)-methyltransferase [Bacillus sp. (in: firmicutes)]